VGCREAAAAVGVRRRWCAKKGVATLGHPSILLSSSSTFVLPVSDFSGQASTSSSHPNRARRHRTPTPTPLPQHNQIFPARIHRIPSILCAGSCRPRHLATRASALGGDSPRPSAYSPSSPPSPSPPHLPVLRLPSTSDRANDDLPQRRLHHRARRRVARGLPRWRHGRAAPSWRHGGVRRRLKRPWWGGAS